jgi:hypothetical protein
MPRQKSDIERAAGKLISSIQKEWGELLGDSGAEVSEEVMHNSHYLLGAASDGKLKEFLSGRTIEEYLGRHWVRAHPAVRPEIKTLQDLVDAT